MGVTPASGINAGPGQTNAAASAKDSKAAAGFAGGDFETFLKMLTTQFKNQDPLNPMEGSDFAVQLATFSGVEQQVRTNELLQGLAGQMGTTLPHLTGWIGKEGKAAVPMTFTDRPLTLDIQPASGADSVILVAVNASGKAVSREEIGTGSGKVEWFGRDQSGKKLLDGQYAFRIESYSKGSLLSTSDVPVYGLINEAEVVDGQVRVTFAGGSTAPATAVTGLRDPL
ncbi:flagellar hook capping FlgD N-terminal domain-containing protein [Paracoccus pacificus]|uniref:Basal-body rod modification protein FlgD n=1 Tax=Paracoccus pacificus TaxID=1463598 RepID=A0ABW4R7K4_9RHOB